MTTVRLFLTAAGSQGDGCVSWRLFGKVTGLIKPQRSGQTEQASPVIVGYNGPGAGGATRAEPMLDDGIGPPRSGPTKPSVHVGSVQWASFT